MLCSSGDSAMAACANVSSMPQAMNIGLQVDMTWIKGIHRVIGSLCGSIFGYMCMHWPQSANNPYALTLLLCTWAFLCGALTLTKLRYGAFLACYTGSIVVLVCCPICQFDM